MNLSMYTPCVAEFEAATDRVVVYLSPGLKAELQRLAARENRKLSNFLRQLAIDRVRAEHEAEQDHSEGA